MTTAASQPTGSLASLAHYVPPDLSERLHEAVLSVLTPADIVVFTDMMTRVKNALPAHDMDDLQQIAASSIGLPISDLGHFTTGAALAAGIDVDDPVDDSEDDAEDCYPPAPGYDALDPEMAMRALTEWLDEGKNARLGCNIVITKHPNSIGAMLAGVADATYHVTDGRVEYDFTAAYVEAWRARVAKRTANLLAPVAQGVGASTGQLGTYTGNNFGSIGYTQGISNYRTPGVVGDRADIIGGYNPDKLRREQEEHRRLEAVRLHNNSERDLALSRAVNRVLNPQPNPLTGVPDPVNETDVQIDVETFQDLASVHGEAFAQEALMSAVNAALPAPAPADLILPPPGSPPCPTYVPAIPASDLATVPELLAEAWRTYEFCISTCFVGDSQCAYILDEVTARVARHSYANKQDLLADQQLLVQTLTEVHAVIATAHLPSPNPLAPTAAPVPITGLGLGTGGFQPAPAVAPVPAQGIGQVSIPGLFTSNAPSNGAYNTLCSGTIITNSSSTANIVIGAVPGYTAPYIPAFGEDDKAYDNTFKLLPGRVYRLDDGSSIEVDAVGNYTIHDADAKITYRSSRMREFNRYVNGSDLLGEFIESLGALGASQKQAAAAPLEMFIRWLIFKAAEHDREEPPEDVPPLSADDLKDAALDEVLDDTDAIDIVAMAERRSQARSQSRLEFASA